MTLYDLEQDLLRLEEAVRELERRVEILEIEQDDRDTRIREQRERR